MLEFKLIQDEKAGAVQVRLGGVFDAPAALQLRQLLTELPPSQVVLDFSQVRHFLDAAVGVLSRQMDFGATTIRGIAQHQAQMFRYFGIPLPTQQQTYGAPDDTPKA